MIPVAILSVLLIFPALLQGQEHSHTQHHVLQKDARYEKFISDMNTGMEKMMRDMHSPGYNGNPDADFLAMMIPHHEGAIEMARLVLIHGRDPLTRRLAEEIIASQQVEINAMKQRLSLLRSRKDSDPAEFPALGGTRGAPSPVE